MYFTASKTIAFLIMKEIAANNLKWRGNLNAAEYYTLHKEPHGDKMFERNQGSKVKPRVLHG